MAFTHTLTTSEENWILTYHDENNNKTLISLPKSAYDTETKAIAAGFARLQ